MTMTLPIFTDAPQRPVFAMGPRSLEAVRLLRLSLTDRCNLRCVYCMPEDGVAFSDRTDLLSARDILAVAAAGRSAGIDHFKITGGEPTVHRELLSIVRGLRQLEPLDLSMTTNGLLLDRLAGELKQAGLDRLTISLDTLRPERFTRITGNRPYTLDQVQDGIRAASVAGFERLKINVVIIGGVNDDEVIDFAQLSIDQPWTIRFIEYMPLGDAKLLEHGLDIANGFTVDNAEILHRIERHLGEAEPVDRNREAGVGPAQLYRLRGANGRIGFISAMSKPFCETCNRLRLTATGELRACLFDGGEVDLLPTLRAPGDPVPRIVNQMRQCVAQKPQLHSGRGNRAMSQMGG
jgi:cyclic pyranopterin phosphate synthase